MAIEYTDSQPSGLETAMRRCKEGAAFIETRPSCHQCGAPDARIASQRNGTWVATCRSCVDQDDVKRLAEFRQGLARPPLPEAEAADLGALWLVQARLRLARQR